MPGFVLPVAGLTSFSNDACLTPDAQGKVLVATLALVQHEELIDHRFGFVSEYS
jgi:hypothetical protein